MIREPLRILIIIVTSPEITGMERVVFDLARSLVELGNNVSVLCPSFLADFYGATGARIIGVPLLDRSVGELIAAFELSLIGKNYDVIHVHGEGSCIVRALALACRTKTIVTLHGGEILYFTEKRGFYAFFTRACMNLAAARASRIVAVSTAAALSFTRFRSKLSIVPNGVNVENARLIASEHRDEAAAMADAKRQGAVCLFFPGRLIAEQKGQDIAIRAIAILTTLGFDARLFLAGAGKDQSYLRNLSKELAVEDRVLFLGHLSNETTLGYMGCADIVMTHLATDTRFAGVSQVHLEAAALSKPIITVYSPDLAIFRKAMFFTRAGGPEEVSATVLQIMKDKENAEGVGIRAANTVGSYFSWETIVNIYLNIYGN